MNEDEIRRQWSGGKETYKMRRSKTPCPGCGEVGKPRPSDRVCLDCFNDLIEMKEVRKKLQASASGEAEALKLPWAPHSLPYIPNDVFNDTPESPNTQRAFYWLMEHFGKPVSGATITAERMVEPDKNSSTYSSDAAPRLYPPGTRKLAQALFSAIMRLAENAHATGVEEGNNLLGKLASGESTVKDYEEDLTRKTTRRTK